MFGENIYTIEMLAEMVGEAKRTVRYYIHRNLLPPPCGKKRGSYYTDEHLERLQLIVKLGKQGVPLNRMPEALEQHDIAAPEGPQTLMAPWTRVQAHEGVELHCRPNVLTPLEQIKVCQYVRGLMAAKQDTGDNKES